MPIRPTNVELNATSVEILNAIRENASAYYQSVVPVAVGNTASIREIGNVVTSYTAISNEFLSALYNRIGRVIITSRLYRNPWSMFKQGILEMGETIEEIFVNIAKPFQYNPATAAETHMRREIPDVRSTFHPMNYQKFYKVTIQNEDLRLAFLSMDGVTNLIAKIVESMYTGVNYDEFQVMKYMLARMILDGKIKPVEVDAMSADNAKSIVSTIKGTSNQLTFLSPDYNIAHVMNSVEHSAQYVIMNATFDATVDVNVLAAAFNMDRAQFMGNRVLIDSFGAIDNARLEVLFADDPHNNYTPLTSAQLTALDAIPAVIASRDFFMIFDNLQKFTEEYNGEGMYWNYWLHAWKTFSTSPFAPVVLFVPGAPGVTSVTVSPATATVGKGNILGLSAAVVTQNFAPKDVTWSINSELSAITNKGVLTVGENETAAKITVTCTSNFDTTKKGTAEITVAS